jgi:hypothetical protein
MLNRKAFVFPKRNQQTRIEGSRRVSQEGRGYASGLSRAAPAAVKGKEKTETPEEETRYFLRYKTPTPTPKQLFFGQ